MKLVIDYGNTTRKYFFFDGKELTGTWYGDKGEPVSGTEKALSDHGPFSACILSSVIGYDNLFLTWLRSRMPVIQFSAATPIPIENHYLTPETLGPDRLAAAVGGHSVFPDVPVLVIDAGTCIKYDLVVNHAYKGGIIAPGIGMQARALHTFTEKLPLMEPVADANPNLVGRDTDGSLLSGIVNVTLASMEGIIAQFGALYPGLRVMLTGGDLNYFDKRLKCSIFALPNLVAQGLNEILDFNEDNRQT